MNHTQARAHAAAQHTSGGKAPLQHAATPPVLLLAQQVVPLVPPPLALSQRRRCRPAALWRRQQLPCPSRCVRVAWARARLGASRCCRRCRCCEGCCVGCGASTAGKQQGVHEQAPAGGVVDGIAGRVLCILDGLLHRLARLQRARRGRAQRGSHTVSVAVRGGKLVGVAITHTTSPWC